MIRRLALVASPSLAAALLALACGGKIDATTNPVPAPTVSDSPAGATPKRPPTDTPPEPPPPRDVTDAIVVDLGTVGIGQEVTLTVPAGALGFNVVVESRNGASDFVGIERITSPSGEVVARRVHTEGRILAHERVGIRIDRERVGPAERVEEREHAGARRVDHPHRRRGGRASHAAHARRRRPR